MSAYDDCIHDPIFLRARLGRYQAIADAYLRATGREPAATDIGHGYWRMRYEHQSLADLEAYWRAADGRDPVTPVEPVDPIDPTDPEPAPAYPTRLEDAVGMVVGYGPLDQDGRIASWFAPGRFWRQFTEPRQRAYARWLRQHGLNAMWFQASTWHRSIMREREAEATHPDHRELVHAALDVLASEGISVVLECVTVERARAQQEDHRRVHQEIEEVTAAFGGHPNILAIMPTREIEKLRFPSFSISLVRTNDRVRDGIGGCFRAVARGWGDERQGRPILYHGRSWAVPASGMMEGLEGPLVWGVHTKLPHDDRQPFEAKDDHDRERRWAHAAQWIDYWDPNRRRVLGSVYAGYCLFETVVPPKSQVPGHQWGAGYTIDEARALGAWYQRTLRSRPICDLSMGTR